MKVIFDIKVTAKDLFRFNMMQAYRGMQGFLSILLPILVFAYAVTSYGTVSIGSTLVYIGLGIMFLVYVPISLWLRVNKTVKDENNALSKSIHYEFEEKTIRVSVGEESVEFKWENILGQMVFVAQANLHKGGTWQGTTANLRHNWSPVLCFRDGNEASFALEQLGAYRKNI